MPGYEILRRDRVGLAHGGILVYGEVSLGHDPSPIKVYNVSSGEIFGFNIHGFFVIHPSKAEAYGPPRYTDGQDNMILDGFSKYAYTKCVDRS